MAGSIKWFVYTTDNGDDFAIKRDESNTEAVNGSVQDFPEVPPTQNAVPSNIKPRYLVYSSSDRLITRNIVALTPTIFNNAETAVPTIEDDSTGSPLILFRKVGEVVSLPFGADTGQRDGDGT